MANYTSKLNWAWKAQFLSHTLLILKIYTTFKDVQMMLKRFFDIYWFQIFKDQCGVFCPSLQLSLDYLRLHLYYYYRNRFMYFGSCYRGFGRETVHPTQKFTSMNLLQMSCMITQAQLFLTSEVMEAVRGQKPS